MLADFIRQINASQNAVIKPEFEFIEFDDVTAEKMNETGLIQEELDIYAALKIHYEGELPESYKVLNLMIGDWEEKNIDRITKIIHDNLKQHFAGQYPGSDISELDEETSVWTDQLDFMPVINPDDKSMTIEVELVLNAEPLGEEK